MCQNVEKQDENGVDEHGMSYDDFPYSKNNGKFDQANWSQSPLHKKNASEGWFIFECFSKCFETF